MLFYLPFVRASTPLLLRRRARGRGGVGKAFFITLLSFHTTFAKKKEVKVVSLFSILLRTTTTASLNTVSTDAVLCS